MDEAYDNGLSHHIEDVRERKQPVELTHDLSALLGKLTFPDVDKSAHNIIDRYERGEIDAVYLVYNEFKSVIAQRVVVEKLLPIRKLGSQEITAVGRNDGRAEGRPPQRRRRTAGISINATEDSAMEEEAKNIRHGRRGLPLR